MSEQEIIENEEELHDDEQEVMEAMHKKKMPEAMHMKKKNEAHDPKNAEQASIAATDKAGGATGSAPKRKAKGGGAGDKSNSMPMEKLPGTKAGMINAAFMKMNTMTKEQLTGLLGNMMAESTEEVGEDVESPAINYQADFSGDLNALIADEATLSEEFKAKAEIIFEAAIKSKLSEEIDRLEEKYNEELAEEVAATKAGLVEKVDSYLNYVVENWMEENKLAIQNGLRTEIAEEFMNKLKDLFTESYIEVPESKVDLVDDLSNTVEELEEKLNKTTGDAIQMAEQLEVYQRDAVIREASRDLAETEIQKLKKLTDDVDFNDEDTFMEKVTTIKESYFKKAKSVSESADVVEDDDNTVEAPSDVMAQYIAAIQKSAKK